MYCRFDLMTSVPPGEEGRPLGGKLCRDWLAGEEVGPAPQGRLGLASLPPAFQASHATLLPSTHRKDVSAVRCPVLPVNVAPWRGRPQAAPFPMMTVPVQQFSRYHLTQRTDKHHLLLLPKYIYANRESNMPWFQLFLQEKDHRIISLKDYLDFFKKMCSFSLYDRL